MNLSLEERTVPSVRPTDYVETNRHGNWDDEPGSGIVRAISDDGRILYVEEPGDAALQRYSPNEVRPAFEAGGA